MTPHAVRRYILRYRPGLSYEQALEEIIVMAQGARLVRRQNEAELWRGPRPMRIRFVVKPAPDPSCLPSIVTFPPGGACQEKGGE